jgi:hypothetical protein
MGGSKFQRKRSRHWTLKMADGVRADWRGGR